MLDELWIVEDLPYAGGISQLTAVLAATDDGNGGGPVVGHGIAPAPFRNPAALAMEWATLAEMYPGRLAAGIGHGVQSWMAQIGERVDSPLTLLDETLSVVQRLLGGERVDVDGRYVRCADVELVFPPAQPPSVSAGVMGPKSLHLSGALASGTVLPEGRSPDDVVECRRLIDEGRASANRTDAHRLTVFTGYYCGDLAELGPPPPDAPPGWAAVGPSPEVVAPMLRELADAGADTIVLVPFARDFTKALEHAVADLIPLVEDP